MRGLVVLIAVVLAFVVLVAVMMIAFEVAGRARSASERRRIAQESRRWDEARNAARWEVVIDDDLAVPGGAEVFVVRTVRAGGREEEIGRSFVGKVPPGVDHEMQRLDLEGLAVAKARVRNSTLNG